MSRYTPLFNAIASLYANHRQPDFLPSPKVFPFKTIYRSQLEVMQQIPDGESVCITSHTGWGKTPVFQALVRNKPALVIEPRKFLQNQVAKYYNDTVLFGRSGYHCQYAPADFHGSKTAAMAPCLAKESCDGTTYHDKCPDANSTCLNNACDIFEYNGTYHKYPCQTCEYQDAMRKARGVITSGGCLICNFGNFWSFVKNSDVVVIDEADLFFKEISKPLKLKYSNPKKNPDDNIQTLLNTEVKNLQEVVKDSPAKTKYMYQNLLYSAQFLKQNHELCFMYQRKDAYFIEVDPRNVSILAKKLFKDKQVIVVSATPGLFEYPSFSGSIHQRCGIFFAPVGNLTTTSLMQNPYLMSSAAKAIAEISTYMELVYDADRVVVHCGNLGTHATGLFKILGEDDCVMHSAGKLNETIEKYLQSGKKYLLVAAAEYGMDATWCKLQFILKFPYPKKDERINTLKRVMGPKFSEYYTGEARTRVIQMAGRNVRGFDDFGITICLDTKCQEDYMKNTKKYPSWFQERVDRRCY